MFRKVTAVYPLYRMTLLVWFQGGEAKFYDVEPLTKAWKAFEALRDPLLFSQVRVDGGGYGISWNDDLDLSGNELYENGKGAEVEENERNRVIEEVSSARKASGLSQSQLEEAAGVRQPVIARLEKGDTAPRLDTLIKVLAPLGKTLRVVDLAETADESGLLKTALADSR